MRPVLGPGEPGLVPEMSHSQVHQGMEPAKSKGIIWELNGALKGCSWAMTGTGPGSRVKGAHTKRERGQRSVCKIMQMKSATKLWGGGVTAY